MHLDKWIFFQYLFIVELLLINVEGHFLCMPNFSKLGDVLFDFLVVFVHGVMRLICQGIRDFEASWTSTQPQDQVNSALLFYFVIGEKSSIFKLFTSEDESLLICWDPFLCFDKRF